MTPVSVPTTKKKSPGILPWIICVLLAGAAYAAFSSGKAKDEELTKLRQDTQELEKLRAENADLKKLSAQSDELERLRKDNKELYSLRSQVRQLDDSKVQIGKLQAEIAQLRSGNQQMADLNVENQRLRQENAQAQQARAVAAGQANMDACKNNLRIIEAAKAQWAAEKGKRPGALVSIAEITPYFPGGRPPQCPGGGSYTVNPIGINALCNIPGHNL